VISDDIWGWWVIGGEEKFGMEGGELDEMRCGG